MQTQSAHLDQLHLYHNVAGRQTGRQIAVHTLTEVKLSQKAARGSPAAARLMALCSYKPASSACSQLPKT